MVLLVHHGEAEAPGVDPRQPLSGRGRAQAARVALELADRRLRPDVIWHSGKLRARQTAEACWRAANPLAPLTAVRGLLPGDPPAWMRDALAGEPRTIAVVGHYPHLPALFELMVGEASSAGPAAFPVHGVVVLGGEGERWRELWRLKP